MNLFTRRLLFLLFFVSGFSSLVYQVVWTRLAFASFGIISPVLSAVLSIFMLGLSVGAWSGGRFVGGWVRKTGVSAVAFYAVAELLIGLSAFVVPQLFAVGEHLLLATGQTNSNTYLGLSTLVLAVSILPWCVLMGTTFPLVMAYVRECDPQNAQSFSFLYLANVLGAMSGTILTALVLVELLGFRQTLWVAAAGNFGIAALGGWMAWKRGRIANFTQPEDQLPQPAGPRIADRTQSTFIKWILFSTGFCAMGMEVVWTRAFTPVLNNQVYSFAMIVFVYLGATFLGSLQYRRDLKKKISRSTAELIAVLAVAVFLPVVANDPRFVAIDHSMEAASVMIVLGSICPLCALLGYLTPKLIDEFADGNPASAGQAYAINVLGCILGPAFASYVLLPLTSERHAIILLGVPFVVSYFLSFSSLSRRRRLDLGLGAGAMLICSLWLSGDFEGLLSKFAKRMEVRRDYAASVISTGDTPGNKCLFVNGINMTALTPITKFMVHLPLAFHNDAPKSVLIICFGMGTSYRSALSWEVETTAVELVPSVKDAFGFYHADAATVSGNPKGRVIIDDGRRYLKRTADKFDVIVIDPPPPVEAAGSSLLYSHEFYELAKQHMNPGAILQAWFPGGGEPIAGKAVMRSVCDSFPYVRCFGSIEGTGLHILASMSPIEPLNAEAFIAQLPEGAKVDLLEWSPAEERLPAYIERVLSKEHPPSEFSSSDPRVRITDDRPFNEYFLLRRVGSFNQ